MKRILYIIAVLLLVFAYMGCNEEDYTIHRIAAPSNLTATRGDTSVFLKWDRVEGASFYTLVRGLNVIADSLLTEYYEDDSAPDTLTEYRIYAVDNMGWRSQTYASDSGYLGIPDGILPRVPSQFKASTDDVRGCVLSWSEGRFATSYQLYKNGEFYMDVVGNEFIDIDASIDLVKYTLYSENRNGISINGISADGKKAYLCLDDFEEYENGSILQPWTQIADRTMFYTEGDPKIVEGTAYSGTKSLLISNGKVQILHDWGGAQYEGFYAISFMARKNTGEFNVYSSYGTNEVYSDVSDWTKYTYRTGLVSVGEAFNLTIESKADASELYVDDFSIEYIAVP